jgi:16S rRNA (uracil1498-N3)-methyltransferase
MTRLQVPKAALRESRVEIRGADLRYLRSVLRLGPGARLELFDGEGVAFEAQILSIGSSAAEIAILGPAARDRESPLSLTLAVALSKGAKLDWTVEKATELGVTRVLPFTSERTVPERDRFEARCERWRRIARAASAQSGRSRCPEIADVADLSAVLGESKRHDRAVLFWEGGGEPLERGSVASAVLVTGPEGGFSAAEVDRARSAGFRIAGLGPRILRAETAAVAATALAQHLWGDAALVSTKTSP